MTSRWCLENVVDEELVSGLECWVERERDHVAAVIAHIAEIDSRKLYLERGYQSMHDYCVRRLNMSEDVAFKRIAVGRVARRYPRVLDMIAAGELHVSGAKVLAAVLDDDNVDRLLDAVSGQTRRRIEEIVAAERPRPDVATRLCEVPELGSTSQLAPGPVASAGPGEREYAKVEALAPGRYALQVTISKDTHDKLREAQDLMRHAVPDADVAEILDRALDLLVEKARKRQFAETDRPRKAKEPVDPEGCILAAMRREVAERDGYRCTFEAEDGTRCGARTWLQFDHIVPRTKNGPTAPENLRLLCGPHNRLEAERKLGAWVREVPRRKKAKVESEAFQAARQALVFNGYKDRQAREALEAIRGTVEDDAPAEVVLREALRALYPTRCGEALPVWQVREVPVDAAWASSG